MQRRLFLILFLVSLVATLPSVLFVYLNARSFLAQQASDRLELAGTFGEHSLKTWLSTQVADAKFVGQLAEITAFSKNLSGADSWLAELTTKRPELSGAFLLGIPGGQVVAASNLGWKGQYFQNSQLYQEGRNKLFVKKTYTWPTSLEPTITITLPVGTNLVAGFNLRLDQLDNIRMAIVGLGKRAQIYLVDSGGFPVSAQAIGSKDWPRGLDSLAIDEVTKGLSGSGTYQDYRGQTVIGNYRWLPELGLGIVVEIAEITVLEPAFTLGIFIVGFGLATILLSGILSLSVARSLSRPLAMLSQAAEALAGGSWNIELPLQRRDEIGSLARSFARMARSLQHFNEDLTGIIKERTDQLIEAEKLALLGRLVAGVAHEINTPLGVAVTATSYTQIALQEIRTQFLAGSIGTEYFKSRLDRSIDSLNLSETNLARAAEFIRSFKQVAVDQALADIRTINLAQYLQEVVISLSPRLKLGDTVVVMEIPPELQLTCVPAHLYQIVTNLVVNSLMHAFEPDQAKKITITVQAATDGINLLYRDNGRGIDPILHERIFEPFFTTARQIGGSGLGLFIVKNLIVNGGGSIHVLGGSGHGAQFSIYLPGHPLTTPNSG